jgi:hypothetical protein
MDIIFKGKSWDVKPLPAAKMIEHATAMRDLAYSDLKKSLVGLPLVLCKELFVTRAAEIRKIQHATKEHRESVLTFHGISHAIYLALSGAGAEVTPVEADDLLETDPKLGWTAAELMKIVGATPVVEPAEAQAISPVPFAV